jgi:predicted component of type VI protein secretion system
LVEHLHGKEGVAGSSPAPGSLAARPRAEPPQARLYTGAVPDIWLVVQEGPGTGAQHPIEEAVTIGRDQSADLQLRDKAVSRRHATVRVEGETAVVEDLGSRNGTYVNGERVDDAHRLREGDAVQVGATVLEIRSSRGETAPFPPPATPTESHPAPGPGQDS